MSSFLEVSTLYVKERRHWRAWLEKFHDVEKFGIWLVYYKQHTGKPTLEYNESVEEALCFGWVDSLVRRLDDEKFARKFTPRKDSSNWSESNRRRVEKLIAQGRMTEYGMASVEAARASGRWHAGPRPEADETMPPGFAAALAENLAATDFYNGLSAAQQKQFIVWINVAKKTDTKARRLAESIRLLEQGRKLGMK